MLCFPLDLSSFHSPPLPPFLPFFFLRRHENVIGIWDVLSPGSHAAFDDVYIVYDLMDTDLHQIIRSNQPLTDEHFQYFVYQVLRGLKYVHSAGVLHRDLKPSNLLLNASCDLRIGDFGLARTAADADASLTEYVVTRWYRAPELLLSCDGYDGGIDVWSVGCILAELLGRAPLFPGRDYIDQLKRIVGFLGTPSEDELGFVTAPKARAYVRAMARAEPVDLAARFPDANPLARDLLKRMLTFDPRRRISVEQALAHPWLAALHDPASEPVARGSFRFDFEERELDAHTIRALAREEIARYAAKNQARIAARRAHDANA